MAKHDQDGGSTLAAAVGEALGAGGLEPALHAARAFFMHHPGDGDAKRAVEALELAMAQVWFRGAEEGAPADARFVEAADHLASGDLDAALARYESVSEGDAAARAGRLVHALRVVLAAASGAPLPERPEDEEDHSPVEAPNLRRHHPRGQRR